MRHRCTRFTILCCAAFLGFAAAFSVRADEAIPASPIVKTALLVDAPTIKKDVPIWAAVRFTIPPHWHIYWQNPGDSGIPTTMAWTLPGGLAAGDIAWPRPERIEVSGLVNYGYSNAVVLAVPLTPSRDGIDGSVTVKANWLVCQEACVPESAVLTAPLVPNPTDGAVIAQSRSQVPVPFENTGITYATDGVKVVLTLPETLMPATDAQLHGMVFFPVEDGLISNNAAQVFAADAAHRVTMTAKRGSADLVSPWHGVIEVAEKNYAISATLQTAAPLAAASQANAATGSFTSLPPTWIAALVLAFFGGLILNIMPCVLPILALKALAIARKAQASRQAAARQGIAYTIGVVGSFLIIASIMLALKASGTAIGWGFQLQNSTFVASLAVIMLLVSANLLGLFSLPVLFGRHAHEVNENSRFGSFLTGALAVLVATPCTAPFMATAIGATLTLPPAQTLSVFAALGLGMAAPFLLISLWPAALRCLPKPGAWMHRFKQILALPMLATTAWLVWVLMQLHGAPMQATATHVMFSEAQLETLRSKHAPVLVDATAAWCLTCKINERMALNTAGMQQFLAAQQVTLMVADWTNSDPAITTYLASFGRNGVPLYVYYPPQGAPQVLPQILTPSLVRHIIDPQHD